METLLEQQRRYHEERERLMDGMVQVGLFNSVVSEWYLIFKFYDTILSCFDLTGAVVHEGKPQRQHQQ